MKTPLASLSRVFGLIAWAWAAALSAAELPFSPQQIENLGIRLAMVETATTVAGGHLPGRVAAPPAQTFVVSAPQAGLLSEVRAAVGDAVRAGDVLARLQSQELIDIQLAYLQALIKHSLAQTGFERDDRLFKEGVIAERRYLDTRSQLQEVKAELEAQQQMLALGGMSAAEIKRLTSSRQLSGNLEIRAPAAGVVLETTAVGGQRVEPMSLLFKIADLSKLWLEINAPQDRLPALGTAFSVAGSAARGQITLVGRSVDPQNQTVLARGEVSEHAEALRVGQFVEVHVDAPATKPYLQAPSAALARSGTQTVVFMRSANGFTPQPVTLISEHDKLAVFSAELPAQAQVAVSGLSALKAAWLGQGE
jgi:cobalt-zinc-cadmium efflux system membrane fusion protein